MTALEPAVLRDCEAARDRLGKAEDAAVSARVEFESKVRRLYVQGASTREIADVLGLSHQRVHQMIGPHAKPWWKRVPGVKGKGPLRCSFCGKDEKRVQKLVSGTGVHMCNGCIETAAHLIDHPPIAQKRIFKRLDETSAKRCSFCGSRKRGLARVTAGANQICANCVAMAEKIVAGVGD